MTLTASDTGGSGVDKTHYTTDGSTPTIGSAVYDATNKRVGIGTASPGRTFEIYGTTSGTGVVWIVNATASYGIGTLQAYAAVPDSSGEVTKLYEDTFGPAVKFAPPGVGTGRLYVGTADGRLLAYGSPVSSSVSVAATQFGIVPVGSSRTVGSPDP